jgi:la-related protein 1
MSDWDVIAPLSTGPSSCSVDFCDDCLAEDRSDDFSRGADSPSGEFRFGVPRSFPDTLTSNRAISNAAHDLLSAFDEDQYAALHLRAMQQRENQHVPKPKAVVTLYYFWCWHLRQHFDQLMYDEFLTLARADADGGQTYGIQCFFRMCSYGLETRWDPMVWRDFQDEVRNDLARGSLYGLEKLKAFLVHNKLDVVITVDDEISHALRPFPTLEAFKERGRGGRPRAGGGIRKRYDARPRRPVAESAPTAESPIRRRWLRRRK